MATSTERTKDPYKMGFLLAPRVPQGLAAVVESLTREVLRQRPEDIYVFAARHFEKLLTLRERYDVVDKKTNKEYDNFANTIKKRNDCKEKSRKKSEGTTKDNFGDTSSGWSLNETAKVLERHRNIFGDGEKRISTDEIRALAKEKNLRSSSSSGMKNKQGKRKTFEINQEYSRDNLKSTTNNNNDPLKLDRSVKTLKIISQIPTVLTRNSGRKDIKMELRKNRLSGSLREKSTDSSNEGQFQEQISDISRKSSSSKAERAALIQNFEEERIKRRTARRSESVERNSNRSSRSRKRKDSFNDLLPNKRELSKTRSMDQVRDYVVRTFGSVQNIDELDTSYVEQVQNVIDKNVPIIKDKFDELKNDILLKKSKKSTFDNDKLKKRGSRPNTSESDTRSNEEQDKYRSKRSSSVDSTDFRRQQDDTLENRLINTQNILEGISSKCYPKTQNLDHRSKSNNGYSNEQENRYPTLEGNSKITLPAVRPSSSKNCKNLSRNDSNNLILPPISPDTGKIPKKKDNMTLPTLSSVTIDTSASSSSLRSEEKENNSVDSKNGNIGNEILQLSTSIKEDISSTRKMLENVNEALNNNQMIEEMSSTKDTTNDHHGVENFVRSTKENLNEILGEEILDEGIMHAEEVFKDSLNVTPDIIDIPPSPDSLEPLIEDPRLLMVEKETELKEKLIEIEEIENDVKKVIDSFEDTINKDEAMSPEPVIVEGLDDSIVTETDEPVEEKVIEIIEVTTNLDRPEETSSENTEKSIDEANENSIDRTKHKSESESDNVDISQLVMTNDDKSTGRMESDRLEINKSVDEVRDIKEIDKTVDDEETINEQKNSSLSLKEKETNDFLNISLSKEVPFSYILTEGSPVEIPDFVTTVIIPERPPSTPEFDLDIKEKEEEEEEEEEEGVLREERQKRAVESFGEYIRPEQIECSTVDIDFIRGIKASHDIAIIRQDLDGIKEEEEYDEEKQIKPTNEEKKNNEEINKDDRSPLLEHISENEENETDENDKTETKNIPILEIEIESENNNNDKEESIDNSNVIENLFEVEESTETADVTSESTNEVKETTITDRSTDSLSLDPARPIVPELNLDSLRDITISSFKMNDADETVSLTEPTLSGKEKIDDLEENVESKENENSNSGQKEETSTMETFSMDEKPIEMESSLIHLEKEEHSISTEEIVKNEVEQLIDSNETNIQPVLNDNVEQCEIIKHEPSHLECLEENTTDLDTEEEIAKELIEIDRAENRYLSQNIPIVSEDHLEEKSHKTLDSNGAIENLDVLTIVEEENIKSKNEKQDQDDSSSKNEISDISGENLIEITSPKHEEENNSERMKSVRSTDNEKEKDQSDGSLENNVLSDTSVTAFEEVEGNVFDTQLAEKKEYHIYLMDLKPIESQEEDSSKNSNISFHSAVITIQAGIRGFLTRKKLQKKNLHGSTLDSIPSIQESITEEAPVDDLQSVSEVADTLVKSTDALSSAMTSENVTIVEKNENIPLLMETVSMPTKQRQCLRREDAIQRNTLSMENAFASGGVQHTGEFHDCLPLPVLESIEITKSNVLSLNKDRDEVPKEELIDQNTSDKCTKEENTPESPNDLTSESNRHNNEEIIENIDRTQPSFPKDLNNLFDGLQPKDLAKLLVNQANRPIVLGLLDIVPNSVLSANPNIIFETNTNLNANDDQMQSVKDDLALQNRYLDFITSVEDNESSHVINTLKEYKDRSNEHSIQSLREPLALPGTPEGVLIEELSSLDSTTMSKLQDISFNPISLESTTMDRESIEKSIDSRNSTELLDKSDDVNVQTPITAKREDEITIKDDQPITKESVTSTCTKSSTTSSENDEQSRPTSGTKEIENNENKETSSDEQEENQEANLSDKNENKEANLDDQDENKKTCSDEQEENKEANLDEKDENEEASSDDKGENKETCSDEQEENQEANLSDKDENEEASSVDKGENNKTSSDEKNQNMEADMSDKDENKETNLNEKDQIKEVSSDEKDEINEASSNDKEENKETLRDKDENNESSSDNKDENKEENLSDVDENKKTNTKDENKEVSSDEKDKNLDHSKNEESI